MCALANTSMLRLKEIGKVVFVKKIIAGVQGLTAFMNGQLVTFDGACQGMIIGFTRDEVMVLILGDESKVRIGQEVVSIQKEFTIPVGKACIGRIINPLMEPIDNRPLDTSVMDRYPVFREAPQTMDRAGSDRYLLTGTKMVDALVPIARGQRQMIIGDRMTGKTTLAVDAITHQQGKDIVCIYCCIGKSSSSLTKVVGLLKAGNALAHTIVMAASASAVVGQQYLAPYCAAALGEYFYHQGQDVLVVFDDMTKHAWAYRQISLLMERPPGREAYPGDIYYIHAQLMERAGKLNRERGGGSMSFFPIVDTLQQDVTGFIPSNLIAMTDGQIYLNSSIFAEGFKPAIDLSMSVSIVGGKCQHPLLKKLSATLRLEYAQYKELVRLTKLKSSFSADVLAKLRRGEAIGAVFNQTKNAPVNMAVLVVLLYALEKKVLDVLELAQIHKFKNDLPSYLLLQDEALMRQIETVTALTPELCDRLDKFLVEYVRVIS